MSFAGQTSTFSGVLKAPGAGPATLEVLAMQPETANFGWVRKELKVQ